MQKIIDAHVHVWDLKNLKLPWVKGAGYLEKNFTKEDYKTATQSDEFDIVGAIYVEVDVDKNDADKENHWIIDEISGGTSLFKGAVIQGNYIRMISKNTLIFIQNFHK